MSSLLKAHLARNNTKPSIAELLIYFRAGIIDKSIPIRISFFFTKTVYHDLISCLKTHQQIVYGSIIYISETVVNIQTKSSCEVRRFHDCITQCSQYYIYNIASTVLHAYHYNLSLCRCHVQPVV